ncbi:sensor histidine kinase [Fluviicola sp.]|uniref:sensor histidine kinase n=1 Tax=Fluviicola sp. TaxID=1917219 RepID=UPI0028269928|nr:sensor histidine kinase [Fluviicola sp.]MDR0801055.1 sensor histidine kinase [Fluviicola sp.]
MNTTEIITIPGEVKNYFEKLKVKLAFRMSSIFLFVFVVLACAYYFDSKENFLPMSFGVMTSSICLLIVWLTRNPMLVFYIYSTSGVLISSYVLIEFHNTIHLTDVLWMLAAISLAFFCIGRVFGFVLLFVSLVAIAIYIFYSLNMHIEQMQVRTVSQKFPLVIEIIAGFLLNYYLLYLYLDLNRYSERKLIEAFERLKEQNTRILIQNDEKTTLVKEIHHRVKNNLQIVVSLLRIQSQEIDNPEFRVPFQESINRIMAMSLIHQKLYQNDNLSQIRIGDYLNELINEIMNLSANEKGVHYEVKTGVGKIGLKTLIPVGLLINELVSNSLKHAFDNLSDPRIEINIQREGENWLRITYFDNGTWKPQTGNSSFGLVLIDTLIEQLDGSKEVYMEPYGTQYVILVQNSEEQDVLA